MRHSGACMTPAVRCCYMSAYNWELSHADILVTDFDVFVKKKADKITHI